MKFLGEFLRWLQGILKWQPKFTACNTDEMPDTLERAVIYLIGGPTHPWAATFLCPCGCGDTISLSLIATDRPSWRIHLTARGDVTLAPSVWRTKGCHSHFFLRSSRIVWVDDLYQTGADVRG